MANRRLWGGTKLERFLTKAELLQLKLIHLFARDILLIKRLEIGKTKPTFIISVLKVEYKVVLVSSISNLFSNKISLANKWVRKKIPACSNSALTINTKETVFKVPCQYF